MRVEWDLSLDHLVTLRAALARQRKVRAQSLLSTLDRIERGERRGKERDHDIQEICSLDELIAMVNPKLREARRREEG